ncbi:MAG: beta-propeller domain-containing protein [Campylobacterota bacterium]|nr:beta-propeller domain-containing protein [Campylobacterota bacterium]
MKLFIFLIFALNILYANTTISFEKGWSLVGIPKTLSDMEIFQTDKVDVVWSYNATEQKWEGYSSKDEVSTKIADKNISTLETLQPYQAVWVLSNDSWNLSVTDDTTTNEPTNNKIVLKEGWNLIALPNRAMIAKDFFGDAIVWRYKEEWSVNNSSLDFPTIENIRESEGFWVKSEEDIELDMGEELSKLRTFVSEEEMLEYIRGMQKSQHYRNSYSRYIVYDDEDSDEDDGIETNEALLDTATSTSVSVEGEKGSAEVDATTTNTQEGGVDEADILKHDGQYIFSVDNHKKEIFITSFVNVADKNYTAINTIKIEDDSIIDIYLQSNRLVVLSNHYGKDYYGYYEDYESDSVEESSVVAISGDKEERDEETSVKVTIYDVSDIQNIRELSSHGIDGSYNTSRLVDGKLFFITYFNPKIIYGYNKIDAEGVCATIDKDERFMDCNTEVYEDENGYTKEEICTKGRDYDAYHENRCYNYTYSSDDTVWRYDYQNPFIKSENLLPMMKVDDNISKLIEPSKLYAPKKLDQSSTITTISSFDIEDATYRESISTLGYMHTYYASTQSFYLISRDYPRYYNYFNSKSRQMIYKFSLGEKLEYQARGFVDGWMLNQFSMSEKDEYLRVATTQGNSWSIEGTDNSIFTLQADKETQQLEVKSVLSGLGKVGETIKAVRFMGDRGFVVTFRTTDPLYTLDLSDPLNPLKVGELSIPGYSTYLHIVDENRVLSIGRDADENTGETLGLQLQLFDITDFANPLLADKILIGDSDYTYSPAEHNHKAFIYRPSDKMFGVHYTNYNYSYRDDATDNLAIYRVDDMNITTIQTLTTPYNNSYYWRSDTKRGLIFDLNNTTYGTVFEGSNILSDTIKKEEQ